MRETTVVIKRYRIRSRVLSPSLDRWNPTFHKAIFLLKFNILIQMDSARATRFSRDREDVNLGVNGSIKLVHACRGRVRESSGRRRAESARCAGRSGNEHAPAAAASRRRRPPAPPSASRTRRTPRASASRAASGRRSPRAPHTTCRRSASAAAAAAPAAPARAAPTRSAARRARARRARTARRRARGRRSSSTPTGNDNQ